MPERMRFTEARVKAIDPPATGRTIVHSDNVPHLLLQVMPTGAKTWYLYRRFRRKGEDVARPGRVPLGRWPAMTVDAARLAADRVNGDIAKGVDPTAAKREARREMTVGELLTRFIDGRRPHNRASTIKEYERQRDLYAGSWMSRRITSIDSAEARARHAAIGTKHGRYAANRFRSLVVAAYNFGRRDLDIVALDNPMERVAPFAEQPRTRVLQRDEIGRLFQALKDEPNQDAADFIIVALFTGQRAGNVCAMRWAHVNLDAAIWNIPADEMKAGKALMVHLTAPVLQILRKRLGNGSEHVFANSSRTGYLTDPKRAWARVCAAAGVVDARMHDLRRTAASAMLNAGIELKSVSASIGHSNVRTTERVYAMLSHDRVRDAMNAGAKALLAAGKPKRKGKR